jgi:hypothetical protein
MNTISTRLHLLLLESAMLAIFTAGAYLVAGLFAG